MRKPISAWQESLTLATRIETPTARSSLINHTLMQMRKDSSVPHLTLCAFLQDNAKIIKENLK